MNTLTTSFKFSSPDFTNQFAVPHPPCSTGHAPPHFALKTLHKVLAPHGGNSPFKLCSVNSASLSLLPFLSFPSLRYHFFSIRAVFTPLFAGCRTPWASTSCSTEHHFWSGNTAASFFLKDHKPSCLPGSPPVPHPRFHPVILAGSCLVNLLLDSWFPRSLQVHSPTLLEIHSPFLQLWHYQLAMNNSGYKLKGPWPEGSLASAGKAKLRGLLPFPCHFLHLW